MPNSYASVPGDVQSLIGPFEFHQKFCGTCDTCIEINRRLEKCFCAVVGIEWTKKFNEENKNTDLFREVYNQFAFTIFAHLYRG